MKHVQRKVSKGKVYLCFRKAGHPKDGQRLTSPWPEIEAGSALEAEVQALLDQGPTVKAKVSNLAGAIRAYELEDPRWAILAKGTKREYARYLTEFLDDMGELPLTTFTSRYLLDLQNAWAKRGHRAAELRMNCLKNVLAQSLIKADLPDPFARLPGVPHPRTDNEPHRAWPEWVVEAAIEEAIATRRFGLARAIAIGRYTGARREDIVAMSYATRRDGRIKFLSGKRKVRVDIKEEPELTRWLDATPATHPLSKWQLKSARQRGVTRLPARTLVYNMSGDPYTEDGLGLELDKLIERLHAAGKIDRDDYDLHGLRHTMGVELCLAQATDAQGAAYLGHKAPHSFATYRRQANRMLLAASASDLIRELRKKQAGTGTERKADNQVDNGGQPGATIHQLASKKA